MSSRNFLKHLFHLCPIQFLLCAFVLIIFSHPVCATAYTINNQTSTFGVNNTLAVGDSLTLQSGGDLNTTNTAAVIFSIGTPGTTTVAVQSGGIIRTSANSTLYNSSGVVPAVITVSSGGQLLGPSAVNGYGIDFSLGTSGSTVTVANSGTMTGIIKFPLANANSSYTHNTGATLAYSLPGANTAALLDGQSSTNSTVVLNGGTISGRIANFNDVNIGGSFSTSSGTGSDPTGISSCTNINVNAGTFTVAHDLNSITNINIANGATMLFNSGGTLSQNTTGTVTLSGTGILDLNDQSQTITTLSSASTTSSIDLGTATLTVGTSSNSSFAGVISGTGGITKEGTGVLTFSNTTAHTYTGTTTINAGTLRMGGAVTMMFAQTSTLDVGAAGTFDLNNLAQIVGGLSGSGSVNLGTVQLTAGTASNFSFSGIMSGTGGFNKVGTGIITLSGVNTYTGQTFITAGTLRMGIADGLAGTSEMSVGNGTTFDLNNYSQTIGNLSQLLGTGGTVTLGTATLTVGSASNASFSGIISGTGSVIKQGTGTLTLTGNHLYTGTTTINAGTLSIGTGGAIAGPVSIGSATLNMNGGTIASAITGTANSTLSVTENFTTAAAITNVGAITVAAAKAFTISNSVTGTSSLTGAGTVNVNTAFTTPSTTNVGTIGINAGGNLSLANNVTGNINNAGTLTHATSALRTITGNLQNTGTIGVYLEDVDNYSQFQVTGTTTLNGGTIAISLPSDSSGILDQDTFNVITSNVLTVNQLPTMSSPDIFGLSFTPAVNGNNLQIIATRRPLQEILSSTQFTELVQVLDGFRTEGVNSDFLDLMYAVNSQNSLTGLRDVLEQISPAGINSDLFDAASQNLPHAVIETRLGQERVGSNLQMAADNFQRKTGYAAGDMLEGNGSYGPIVFGHSTKQDAREGINGYKALTGGFGFLADGPILENFRLGGAITYASSAVKQNGGTGNQTLIGNVQGTIYGSAYYGPLFIDGLASVGMNNYRGRRNIAVLNQTATANYNGFQYDGKLKGGFTIPFYGIEFSPLATLQYTHLTQAAYTEQGGGIANLSVGKLQADAIQMGIGGSVAVVNQADDFLPEMHALYHYYTKQPDLRITSQFVEGGPAFVIPGVAPPRASLNVGASITAMMSDQFLVTGNYDVELKKGFISHSASFKFKWLF